MAVAAAIISCGGSSTCEPSSVQSSRISLRRRSGSGSFQSHTYFSVMWSELLMRQACLRRHPFAIPWRESRMRRACDKYGFVADVTRALRTWRERRRVSQLELALRAGTTQRHVSFIESGRSAPGRSMMIRLAEALEVPLRERNALLLGAGFAPVYEEMPLEDPKLDAVRTALERILHGHLPYPAVITDRHGDLLIANPAFDAL